jgi:predicted CXXCH cytochrome family protein
MRKSLLFVPILMLGIIVIAAAFFISTPAFADPGDSLPETQAADNSTCLACHGTPGLETELPSGEPLYISIDPDVFAASVHGQQGHACTDCHTDRSGYPHDPIPVQNRRDYALERYTACLQCHQEKYNASLDSVHQMALAAGNKEAAVCTDCHGAHDISDPNEPRSKIPQTCERCHSQIYDVYAESVHGEALIGEGNPDVPTCIDCHGVHNVEGPSNSPFHLFSPQICANCHADPALMEQYDVSTDVFETYVADFHGTTVAIFEAIAPDQETNKPVCIDCHGVHDMKKVDDPESRVIQANLLTTCQRCHPNAEDNFSDTWLSHYQPSPEKAPLVYYVNLFYKFFIPGVLGPMLVFVLADGARRTIQRVKGGSRE